MAEYIHELPDWPKFQWDAGRLALRNGIDDGVDALAHAVAGAAPARNPIDPRLLRPYVGLRAFREEDSAFFFGRTTFVDRLFDRLAHDAVVAVVGASGSGKSSVVTAGLMPRLRRERPPRPTWEAAVFTPGRYPWRRLADALVPLLEPTASQTALTVESGALAAELRSGPDAVVSAVERALRVSGGADRLLLVVDQFEELFTLTADEDRASFIASILEAATSSRLRVVLTLRADFYGRALESSRGVSDVLGRASIPIGPLLPAETQQVIEGPITRVGGRLEPRLLDVIMDAVRRQPGHLPLLEYTLTELWNACAAATPAGQRVELTLKAYTGSGQLEGAIARRAESLFESFNEQERQATRRLFGLLVRVAGGGEEGADTRRRARRSDVGEDAWAVATRFAGQDYRLLVVTAGERQLRRARPCPIADRRAVGGCAIVSG